MPPVQTGTNQLCRASRPELIWFRHQTTAPACSRQPSPGVSVPRPPSPPTQRRIAWTSGSSGFSNASGPFLSWLIHLHGVQRSSVPTRRRWGSTGSNIGLIVLLAIAIAGCAKPASDVQRPGGSSLDVVAIYSLEGLSIDSPRHILNPSLVSFGGDSLCATWTISGRDLSNPNSTANTDTIVLATSANGAAWSRRVTLAVKTPESARLVKGKTSLYALLWPSGHLLLVKPDLTLDTLNALEFPGSHTGIGMDISVQEPNTVWAAYNLIAADENRNPREYIALARWRLGGPLEAISIVASFPRPSLANNPIQLAVHGDRFRILVSPADSSGGLGGNPDAQGQPTAGSVLVLDRTADGGWASVWGGPKASYPAMGLRFDASGGGELGIVEFGGSISVLDLRSLLDSMKSTTLDKNMMTGNSNPIFSSIGFASPAGGGCGLAAWLATQSPVRPAQGRPRSTGPFSDLLGPAPPSDLYVASASNPASPGHHAQSVSDYLVWAPRESAFDLAMAPLRDGAAIIVTTMDLLTPV